jgi:hypothetical protein
VILKWIKSIFCETEAVHGEQDKLPDLLDERMSATQKRVAEDLKNWKSAGESFEYLGIKMTVKAHHVRTFEASFPKGFVLPLYQVKHDPCLVAEYVDIFGIIQEKVFTIEQFYAISGVSRDV